MRLTGLVIGLLLAGSLAMGGMMENGVPMSGTATPGIIRMVEVEGVINPITERFVANGIKQAEDEQAECLILRMDTPGGLASATHNIVKAILNANLPIVTFVSPKGSRAASAGVFIALASDVVAMSPMTNIGAAHPVSIGGGLPTGNKEEKPDKTMTDKITNDMVASVRGIAEKKGRNVKWAESAVRESSSITAEEALKLKVIDFIAEDMNDLLAKLDGRIIEKDTKRFTIHTKGITPQTTSMNFREKFFHAIADPNIAYILLMLGIYGLIYEFSAPGIGLGAVGGGICLILAFFGLQNLPISMAGLLLIILGIILLILEVFASTHGIAAIGGLIALIMGSFMLIDSSTPFMTISWTLIVSIASFTGLFILFGIGAVIAAYRHPVTTGRESLIGQTGVMKEGISPVGTVSDSGFASEGMAFLQGENWCVCADEVIDAGEKVEVVGMEGIRLKVKRFSHI
ncbi:MAG: nodulation protein NfeD [Candidatus Desantisbacteria bacterium]